MDNDSRYTNRKIIYKSAGSRVYSALDNKTNLRVAVKVSRLNIENKKRQMREAEILSKCDHPNIVKYVDSYEYKNNFYIITEYWGRKTLFDYLKKEGATPSAEARKIFMQLVLAIEHCHERGFAHRDIKLENLIYSEEKLLLCDFGFARQFIQHDELSMTWCGTPYYASPEILGGKAYNAFKSDIWSMGIVLFCVMTGGFPFKSAELEDLADDIINLRKIKIPKFVDKYASKMILDMTLTDPMLRPNIAEIKFYKFLGGERVNNVDFSIVRELCESGDECEKLIIDLFNDQNHGMTRAYKMKCVEMRKKHPGDRFRTNVNMEQNSQIHGGETKEDEAPVRDVNMRVYARSLTESQIEVKPGWRKRLFGAKK